MCAVRTISDLVDEGPILVAVAGWDLPDWAIMER